MSIEAIAWVFKQDIRPSSLKFVLVAMADCCREDRLCWPSIARLEKTTSQNRKTIIQAIDVLVARGHIIDTQKKTGKTNQIKIYELNIGNNTENGTVQSECSFAEETVPFLPSNSTVFTHKESQKWDSKPLPKPSSKLASKKNIKPGGKGDFCETWNDEILPYEWQEHAERMFIKNDALFRSWRRFKDVSDWPMSFARWKAWLEREGQIYSE